MRDRVSLKSSYENVTPWNCRYNHMTYRQGHGIGTKFRTKGQSKYETKKTVKDIESFFLLCVGKENLELLSLCAVELATLDKCCIKVGVVLNSDIIK